MIEITLIGAMLLCLGAALLFAFAWQTNSELRTGFSREMKLSLSRGRFP